MIVVYHNSFSVVKIFDFISQKSLKTNQKSISKTLIHIALNNPDRLIIWCHLACEPYLNLDSNKELFHHKKLLLSYNPFSNYFSSAIGYVDEGLYLNINKKVTYPTWLTSSLVGGVDSDILIAINDDLKQDSNFDFFIVSLAKLLQPMGLLSYSEPKLLVTNNFEVNNQKQASSYVLFKFVRQHYKFRWIFLLFLNLLLYEKKVLLLPFIYSFFFIRKELKNSTLNEISFLSTKKVVDKREIDVIIPTIGREKYLYDVLKDFSVQTLLPKKIIIVEQNPNPNSKSSLEYIKDESWPFEVTHLFIHQTGACNARNLALEQTSNEWVFLADDDIRLTNTFLSDAFVSIEKTGNFVFTFNCFQKNEISLYSNIIQWSTFGSGCSIVKKAMLENILFDTKYEFGFGEDSDFGMQLRNKGTDVLFLPKPEILHLKAPIGGFRTKFLHPWKNEAIQPKPSPTVMLYKTRHYTVEQIKSYKTNLYLKYYLHQSIKNPFSYLLQMNRMWSKSMYWSNQLNS